jgi:regulatory protein
VIEKNNLKLTPKQALPKIKQFCAYQERCHKEVKEKLYSYGLKSIEVKEIIVVLIEENFLNETRFATQFTLGKYRLKRWGRNKIKYELKLKNISQYNVNKAFKEIDPDEYYSILTKEATKHFNQQTKGLITWRIQKTTQFLIQKGFEIDLVKDVMLQLSKKS